MNTESMLTIGELAKRAGVSVRALHHYDQIGLLSPAMVTQAGYRVYDAASERRLEQILFFRELGFALEEIRCIMDSPGYDEREAMERQRRLLLMKRDRLDAMIARLDEAMLGEGKPRTEVFDMKEINRMKAEYADEARQRWGDTKAYEESEKKTAAYGKQDWQNVIGGMDGLMAQFAAVRSMDCADERVQALVGAWKQYITDHFYACTDEILAGLAQMYVCDERFKANIDRHGEGTAQFMADAIAVFCAK